MIPVRSYRWLTQILKFFVSTLNTAFLRGRQQYIFSKPPHQSGRVAVQFGAALHCYHHRYCQTFYFKHFNLMPTPTLQATEQPIPVAYTEIDALLHPETEQTLPHHFRSGIPLRDIGETLIDSYNGFPDMISVLLRWMDARSLDSNALLQSATEHVLKAHDTEIITKVDNLLLTSPTRPPVVSSIMSSPRWRRVFSSLASGHSNSTLRYQLERERQLSAIGVSYDIYETPESFWHAIRKTMEDVLGNKSGEQIGTESLDEMYNKLAVIATEDENTFLLTLRILHTLSNTAKSKILRSVSHAASTRVCALFSETLSEKSSLSRSVAKHYAIRLRLVVAIRHEEPMLTENTLTSIFTLITPIDAANASHSDRRRIDKAVGTVHTLYRRLLDRNVHVSQPHDVDAIEEVEDLVIETVSESLASEFVRFALMRMLSYPEMREDLVRTAFTQWCDVTTSGMGSGPAGGVRGGEKTDSRRRRCVCFMLAHAVVASMLSDEQLRSMLSNPEQTAKLRRRVDQADLIFNESAEACMTVRKEIERGNVKRQSLERLQRNMSDMTVAWGVMLCAEEALTGGQKEARGNAASDVAKGVSSNANRHVALLEMVIREHTVLTKDAVEVMQRAVLRGPRKGEPESALRAQRHALLRALASWVKLDGALVVLESFHKDWASAKTMSNEDLRIFVADVLQVVAPPFSPAFSNVLTSLLRHDRVVQAVAEDNSLSSLVLAIQSSAYGV